MDNWNTTMARKVSSLVVILGFDTDYPTTILAALPTHLETFSSIS
jgi:hypothetical protein